MVDYKGGLGCCTDCAKKDRETKLLAADYANSWAHAQRMRECASEGIEYYAVAES